MPIYRVFFTITFHDRLDIEAFDELDARVEFDQRIVRFLAELKPTIFDCDITDILEDPPQEPLEE
jgi:hypothetical protein